MSARTAKKDFPEHALFDIGGAITCPFCVLKFQRTLHGKDYKFTEKDEIARLKIAHDWLVRMAKQRKVAQRLEKNLKILNNYVDNSNQYGKLK